MKKFCRWAMSARTKELIAVAYGNLGLIEKTRGNLDAAEAYHKKSLAIDEELGSKEGWRPQRMAISG